MAHRHPSTKGMSKEEKSRLPHYDSKGNVQKGRKRK